MSAEATTETVEGKKRGVKKLRLRNSTGLEYRTFNAGVVGSNPIGVTKRFVLGKLFSRRTQELMDEHLFI
jgi:hypothetical protein